MANIQELLIDFLEYLEITKARSQLTIRNYDHYLRRFFDWQKINQPKDINPDKVKQFRLRLNRYQYQGQVLKPTTQNYHIIALRSFLKFLARNDIKSLEPEKIELVAQKQAEVEFLTSEELTKLMQAPLKYEKDKLTALRNRAILETLFSTGLRISELTRLKKSQVNPNSDEFTVRGKGGKAEAQHQPGPLRRTGRARQGGQRHHVPDLDAVIEHRGRLAAHRQDFLA